MGWSYECTPGGLKNYLRDLTTNESSERSKPDGTKTGELHKRVCLAHKYVFDNPGHGRLWTVWEYWDENKWGRVLGPKTRFIGYDLLACHKGCWGHKGMSTEMGIGDTSCPLSYLEMVAPKKCSKAARCMKSQYGDDGCTCGSCHGCGACWDNEWRVQVMKAVDAKGKMQQLLKTLQPGDTLMLKDCTADKYPYNQTDGKLPRGIRLKWIDYERTLAAKQGIELED